MVHRKPAHYEYLHSVARKALHEDGIVTEGVQLILHARN